MYPYEKMIVVTDRSLCRTDFLSQIRRAVQLQPCGLILRERDLSNEDYQLLARKVQEVCKAARVPFFIHSRIQVAREIDCPNIHLPLPVLRELGGHRPAGFSKESSCVSVSCHSMEDMLEAVEAGADRIILGTIFETACKRGLRGKGLSFLQKISIACPVPVYAIGGIKESNIDAVIAAGAAGGCMMSRFMEL